MIGKTISHYKILEKLGEGGMGVVYKAEDIKLQRTVALKFLPPEFTRDAEAKERFIREAQAASSLEHANICNIHEIDEMDGGQMFIVMACYEGELLKDKISKGPLPLPDVIYYASQIANGLAKAHVKNIVHRDIKSANVQITVDGVAKILDFGLAKLGEKSQLTKEHTTMGTVVYMSPEQIRGQDVDFRTDIWSLGVLLYEMITGQLPFKGEYESAIQYSILNENPQAITGLRTGVPVELERIVKKALEKYPEKRYQHVDEVAGDLNAVREKSASEPMKKRPTSKKAKNKKRVLFISASFVVVLLGLLLGKYFLLETSNEAIDSIAVLPLTNQSGDPKQDYFADSMTEALITELYKIEALNVRSYQSVRQFKDSTLPLRDIAAKLKVDAVVEGSALLAEDQVRITAQLIEAATDRHLWARDYERDFRNILSLQKDVARAIVQEIKIQVTPQDEQRLGEAPIVDPEAFKLFLKGSQLGYYNDIESHRQAIKYLEQSISKDSTYAPSYIKLAEMHMLLGGYEVFGRNEAESKARQMIKKALELDDNLAEAHLTMALLYALYEWNWAKAEQSYLRAIDLEPGNSVAHWEYGKFLSWMGKFEKGLAEVKYAQQLDPLSALVYASFTEVYLFNHQYDQAIESGRITLEIEPNESLIYEILGWAYLGKKMYQESFKEFGKLAESTNNSFDLGKLGYAYAVSGQKEAAIKVLEEIRQTGSKGLMWTGGQALINMGLGEFDPMLTFWEQIYEMRWPWLILLKVHPMFDPLRSEPRFQTLLKKVGFE